MQVSFSRWSAPRDMSYASHTSHNAQSPGAMLLCLQTWAPRMKGSWWDTWTLGSPPATAQQAKGAHNVVPSSFRPSWSNEPCSLEWGLISAWFAELWEPLAGARGFCSACLSLPQASPCGCFLISRPEWGVLFREPVPIASHLDWNASFYLARAFL